MTTASATRPATEVDLSRYFNNRGITDSDDLEGGAFNIWSNTFPAAELPSGPTVYSGRIPFGFPGHGQGGDNLRCIGQLLDLPSGRYAWIYLLAAAERRTEDNVLLHYADGAVDPEWLRVSDFWPQTPARFGERHALRCRSLHYPRHVQAPMGPVIWRQRVPVPRESELKAIRLPDNPAIHIFALTLVHDQEASE